MNTLTSFHEQVSGDRAQESRKTERPRENGVFRLMSDYQAWIKCRDSFPNIDAALLDDDIFTWYCTICPNGGDFQDEVFDFEIYFDESYPISSPKIRLCDNHECDEWINLDNIEEYSVTSILMELESSLIEGTLDALNSFDQESKDNHVE